MTWYAWLLSGVAIGTVLSNIAFAIGLHGNDNRILRRRERRMRKLEGRTLWWLLLPGWRHRS